mmetsp:Transcript_249/g.1044  ORF Transcript_249/g.1044 Transcript_249/m.1044 type:complete len:203 (+) Transcript_249:575-1183(+)
MHWCPQALDLARSSAEEAVRASRQGTQRRPLRKARRRCYTVRRLPAATGRRRHDVNGARPRGGPPPSYPHRGRQSPAPPTARTTESAEFLAGWGCSPCHPREESARCPPTRDQEASTARPRGIPRDTRSGCPPQPVERSPAGCRRARSRTLICSSRSAIAPGCQTRQTRPESLWLPAQRRRASARSPTRCDSGAEHRRYEGS